MTRFVLATVGTAGDVQPFAALAAALREAGHEVRAISWELHRQPFEAAGAEFVAAGPQTSWEEIAEAARRAADARSPLDQVAILRDFHLRGAVAHYHALREALPGHDLVLLHGIHSLAEAVARDAGLRWATAVFDPVLLPTGTRPPPGLPSLGPLNGAAWWMLDRLLGRLNGPLRQALQEADSPSAGSVSLFRARSPLLHLVACSPALAGVPSDLAANVHFTGAWMPSTPPEPLPEPVTGFLAAGAAPALVSFGSMAFSDAGHLSKVVVDALRQAGLRGIVQAGAAGLAAPESPDVLSVGALDHRTLMPQVAVALHHGGAGTSHTVAGAGVPSVVIPHIGDQAFWADRLYRLGAAPRPLAPRKLTVESLAPRLREAAISTALRAGAARLATLVRAESGLASSIRLLEEAAKAPGR
jgi:sterol 3beta-glucosyltransferase/vancomycin aglycone glucosyltransferase